MKAGEINSYSQTCVQRPPLGREKCGRGSERQISLLRLAIIFRTSKMSFELITTTTSQRQKCLLS
jgi:hypothetical protein